MEVLAKSQQENLLSLLVYNDQHFSFIRNTVPVELFEAPYRDVVRRTYQYIDNYQEAPKDHLGDILEDLLQQESKKKIYIAVLENLVQTKDRISPKYTLDKLEKFVRQQNMKAGVLEAAEILHGSAEPDLDEVETILMNRMKQRLSLFNPGLSLQNDPDVLRFLTKVETPSFPTGILELDRVGLGPIRGGIHILIGGPKAGKSQWFVNLARQGLMHGYRVCIISLEMSEDQYMQRVIQNMCGVTKDGTKAIVPHFVLDNLGRCIEIVHTDVTPKYGIRDPNAHREILNRVKRWKEKRKQLIIKQFPTGSFTIAMLKAYLDRLEETANFIPDLLIVDYADLMQQNADNLRISIGETYKNLRGIGVERDMGVATASQSNRAGVEKKRVGATTAAEDYSKIATADCVLAYNQTEFERRLGVARISVEAARNDADKFEIAIAQNYAMAQFVRDSVMVTSHYHDLVKNTAEALDV